MANDLKGAPIVLDNTTAGAIDGPVQVKMLVWTGCTTAGHQMVIKNYHGTRVIFDLKALANTPIILNFSASPYSISDGINLTTLGSGTVYIY